MHAVKRLPGLDFLRALAILWVMAYHLTSYGVRLPGAAQYGWIGVDLFFVLSGFLVGGQLLAPYASGATPRWGDFLLRRALRVWPAYFTVLAVYFLFPGVRESEGIQPLWQFLTLTVNLFADFSQGAAYSHAWSLCVEEHFYLILPAVVWMVARKAASGRAVLTMLAVLAGGMLIRGWLWQSQVMPHWLAPDGGQGVFVHYVQAIYNPSYARLDGLLAGVALAVVRILRPRWWARAMQWGAAWLAAGAVGLVAAVQINPMSHAGAIFLFPLLALSLALIVMGAVSHRTWLGRFAVPGAAPIAAISFSLYLTHKLAYSWVSRNVGDAFADANLLALAVFNLAALAIASLLYLLVERAGLRVRDRLLANTRRSLFGSWAIRD